MRHLCCLLALLLSQPVFATATPRVAVSIKPVHSLVSAVMQDIAEPVLIIRTGADPHHASLKPSQRKMIGDADLIVWIGPALETGLAKAIGQSAGRSLQLLESGLPEVHAARGSEGRDPHVWLSPANARHIAGSVTEALIELDSANRERYQRNRDRLLARIGSLAAGIKSELSLPDSSYIAHHDAYQYFEKSFGLQGAGFVRNSHNDDAGFSTISRLSRRVKLRITNCIVYDADSRPAILDSLGSTGDTRYARIPGMGLEFDAGPQQWFDMMRKMSRHFRECLQ